MRIAIVGSGVSGLVAAHRLSARNDVTLFEAADTPGGHAHTVPVETPAGSVGVDVGFMVFNHDTYPLFTSLLDELGVSSRATSMTFSVREDRTGREWRGASPRFWADMIRFNRASRELLSGEADPDYALGDFLKKTGISAGFRDDLIVPMGSAVWSADPEMFTEMPAHTFVQFFANHRALHLRRPQWRTVVGGSRSYVDAISARLGSRLRTSCPIASISRDDDGVELVDHRGRREFFDVVVMATHSDQALDLLVDAEPVEKEVLGDIRYQTSRAVLHTDGTHLPRSRRLRAAWNFHVPERPAAGPTVTYDLKALQGLPIDGEMLLSLNREVDPAKSLQEFDFAHPVFDRAAISAQRRKPEIQGVNRTWYCGAYWGYGFHEDGIRSAADVCADLERLG
ncbi:MAG: NAD(P)/FAD-dependent oxidoreductase [Acidimicrobiales bacterium]